MKKIFKSKKIIAVILLIITFFSQTAPVFAASGSGNWAGGQYASFIKTTDSADTKYGVLLRYLINTSTKEKRTVFCAEHGAEFSSSTSYNGVYYTPVDSRIRRACKVAYLGWYKDKGNYVINDNTTDTEKKQYVLTQQLIWETLGQSNATFIDGGIQAEYENFKNNINNQITQMDRRPSFDGQTINIQAGESKTFDDSNGVLASYPALDRTTNGIRVMHSSGSNSITISVDENTNLENYVITDSEFKSWGMIKNGTEDCDTMVYFEFTDGVQNQLYSMSYNDPITLSFDVKIDAYGKIELQKLNKAGDLINGAIFNISGDNYNQDVTVTNGKITIDKLKNGTYTIVEKTAPYGYLLDTKSYNVEVKVNQTATQAVVNKEPTGNFTLTKKNSDKSANLKGAEYRIWNTSFDNVYTTNENGEIKIEGLRLGKYNYQEVKAPEGYLIDNTIYTFELKYKDQYTAVIYASDEKTDEEPTGTITIVKQDSTTGSQTQGDATLKGAVYKIYAKEDIYDKAKTKKFYSKGELVASRTINEKGTTEDVTGLPLGTYMVKEEKAPTGYMIDKNEYEVVLKYKDQNTKVITNTVTSKDKVKEMGVHIFKSGIKVNSGLTPGLDGAEFTIKLNSAVERAYAQGYTYAEVWKGINEEGNLVKVDSKRVTEAQEIAPSYEVIATDVDGNAYTQNKLPYGKYIVKETKTPVDYETAADFTFSITDDELEVKEIAKKTKHLVINNEQLESYIKLIKKDIKTGKKVTLNSTTFEIKATNDIYDRATKQIIYKKGEAISQKIGNTTYTSFTTNADNIVVPDNSYNSKNDDKATITTPLKLPVGSYEITEIKVPNGFLQLESSVKFEIKNVKDFDTDKDGDFIKEVVIKNEQPTGTLELTKTIAVRKDADKSFVNTSDLSGIEFTLYAKEDIIDMADGSVIYKKGQEVDKYNLTKQGKLSVSELPMGKYEVKETKTIDGLVLNNTKYEVKFEQKDITTKVYEVKLNVTNDTTLVDISKTDITGDKELVGAKLTLTDKEGKVIDSWVSTEKSHKIEGLPTGKEYTLTEEIAPDGYVIATSIKFTIVDTNKVQKVNMKDKVVEISKENIAGEEIEGAKLQVLDLDNNVIDEWVSSKEPHKISGLKESETYKLHEEVCVGNYVKASDIEFKVTTDKETQKVVMIDKLVEITKSDITTGEELEGAELEVTDEEGNIIDKWISTKELHQVKGLEEGKNYILREITAPYGYEITEEIKFVVSKDKETQKVEMKDMPILNDITLIKIDADTKEKILDKFTFGLYEDSECTKLVVQANSNKNEGTITFKDLRYGIYYVKEITAPKGYQKSDKVVKVEINDKGIYVDDNQIKKDENEVYSFEFEDHLIETPKTGDEGHIRMWLAVLGLSIIALLRAAVFGKKLLKKLEKE